MLRPTLLIAALALLPLLVNAQAIRCRDPATGKTLYTDQPCEGGQVVVPAPTEEEIRREAEAATQARQDALQREQIALERERLQLQWQAAQAAAQAQQSPANSADCRAARAEASFRAASFGATADQIRTAQYNAALACGQPPPPDLVVQQPYYYPLARPRAGAGYGYGYGNSFAPASGGFGTPPHAATPPVYPVIQRAAPPTSTGAAMQAAAPHGRPAAPETLPPNMPR